jgi:serine/threonine-protein kinase
MTVQGDGFAVVGEVLAGKYRVDKIVGIGGMGMVVAATHLELDQRVAVKFMLPGSQESPDAAARFLREARAAGRLNSDHVCRVMDVGRFDNGTPYIVMEYLRGENLAVALRRRGPLRVSDAVDLILQAIEGLAEAHAHGIIHRDLKPDNLFLARRNDGGTTVKVLDFGISKIAVTGVATGTGDIMGSPAYMAPEQMQASRDVDQRSDVWSLGVVLYQIVVGRLPFDGDSLPLLCLHVVNDEPKAMSAVRGDLPDGFEDVVMKCMAKEPAERYADVGELAQALAPFGPADATTSASRIQIVLRRAQGHAASVISHEFSTVAPTLDHEQEGLVAPRPPTAQRPPAQRPPRPMVASPGGLAVSPVTTLGASGQLVKALCAGQSWGVLGGIGAAVGLVVLVVVMVWRSGQGAAPAHEGAPGVAGVAGVVERRSGAPAVPPVANGSAAHGPIVTPIEPAVDPIAAPPRGPIADEPPRGVEVISAGGSAAPPTDRKKRRPRRTPVAPVVDVAHGGSGAGSAAGSAQVGSTPGSSADPDSDGDRDDDDKWTHMTHDEAKP